jgi:hypothetical protein
MALIKYLVIPALEWVSAELAAVNKILRRINAKKKNI